MVLHTERVHSGLHSRGGRVVGAQEMWVHSPGGRVVGHTAEVGA